MTVTITADKNGKALAYDLIRNNFSLFIRAVFKTINPTTEYVHNWHIDKIAEKLLAAERGEIKRLIINMPPRSMKSIIVSVAWSAWLLGHKPSREIMAASFSEDLASDLSVYTRAVLQSEWYQLCFPKTRIASDQNEKLKFLTTERGGRRSVTVGQMRIGGGGDFLIVDDPQNPETATTQAGIKKTNYWYDNAFSTRLNNKKTGVIVIVMQRLGANDLTGYLTGKKGTQWDLLKIPAIGADGRSFFEAREPIEVLEAEKKDKGERWFSGQMQQEPTPPDGSFFKRDWFSKKIQKLPDNIISTVRYWDLASTEEGGNNPDPDYTAGLRMHKTSDGKFIISSVIRFREAAAQLEKNLKSTAEDDQKKTQIWIEQEGGSGGKNYLNYLVRFLAGFAVRVDKPDAAKTLRASPFAAQAENGNVLLLEAEWNDIFIEELIAFPDGKHDDMVDAAAGAFNKLTAKKEIIV